MSEKHHKELTHDRLTDRFDELMDDYDLGRRTEVLVDDFSAAGSTASWCSTPAAASAA